MHCTHPEDPSPSTTTPNLWDLYLDSESLQRAVDCWPKDVAVERFLSLLFSEKSTLGVTITEVHSTRPGKPLQFEVRGRCYQNTPCSFKYELNPKQLTYAQKEGLREFVKVLYHKEAPNYPMAKRICRALGVAFK